jgi:hypothetical protein
LWVAELLTQVRALAEQAVGTAGRMPQGVTYRFGGAGDAAEGDGGVQKTRVREVRSVRFGCFLAREAVMRAAGGEKRSIPAAELGQLVPRGANYAFDMIVFVGWKSLMEGWPLAAVGQALREQDAPLAVPASTLYELKLKFLFYLEALHWAAAPRLREYMADRGGYTALVDGTVEGGSPVLLGVTEAETAMVLLSRKIATENAAEVGACLQHLVKAYGAPKRGLHDLGSGTSQAWAAVLPAVPDDVCQYHFCRDVGRDLCESKEQALRSELRRHKLQLGLHQQRKGETQAIARAVAAGMATPGVLQRLLQQQGIAAGERELLAREVVIAIHQWVLDYRSDGQGRGFPFDPGLLYLHRRIAVAERQTGILVAQVEGSEGTHSSLCRLHEELHRYTADAAVVKAAAEYEEAWALFNRLRDVLRLEMSGKSAPLSDPYLVVASDARGIAEDLAAFALKLAAEVGEAEGTPKAKLLETVLTHLEAYAPQLRGPAVEEEGSWERTTNTRERQWREIRRLLRKMHGRSKVGRDLEKLPAALGLLPNLSNPTYVALVLGQLKNLADCFAAVAPTAGAFSHWKAQQGPVRLGRLALREIRAEDLLKRVSDVYAAELLLDTIV